jgi:hypothetical protein
MNTQAHVIPVGGEEPRHAASMRCWCQPLLDEPGLVVHHAKDLREARERHGRARPEECWVIVDEVLP